MTLQQMETRLARRPSSPLFARIADAYLAVGRIQEAFDLCRSGLQLHPAYATAHVVLAKSFAARQDYVLALEALRIALDTHPDSKWLAGLEAEWQAQLRGGERGEISVSPEPDDRIVFSSVDARDDSPCSDTVTGADEMPEEQVAEGLMVGGPDTEQQDVVREEIIPANGVPDFRERQLGKESAQEAAPSQRVEESICEEVVSALALTPKNGGSSPGNGNGISFDEKSPAGSTADVQDEISEEVGIVSKTLAEIYERQGQFTEALKTYRLLKPRRPELAEYFDRKIEEMQAKLQGNHSSRDR